MKSEAYQKILAKLQKKAAVQNPAFTPDYTPEQLANMGVYEEVYDRTKPRLASLNSWPEHWFHPEDKMGWLEWYKKYSAGRRMEDDDRQIKRWLAFKARHGGPMFQDNPTPRRAYALRNWGINPLKLVKDPEALKEQMDLYKAKKYKTASEKPGLWANIRAKRRRGEKPAKPGEEGYPDKKQWKKLTKSAEVVSFLKSKIGSIKEEAKGIPSREDYGDISKLTKGQLLDLVIQKHDALRRGTHRDIRIGNKPMGMFSWATDAEGLPKEEGKRVDAIRTNLHTHKYKDFEGEIPKGEFGAGKVSKQQEGKVLITNTASNRVSFATADKKHPERFTLLNPYNDRTWLLLKQKMPATPGAEKQHYKNLSHHDVEHVLANLKPGEEVQPKIDGALNFLNLNHKAEMLSHRISKMTGKPVVHTERFFGNVPRVELPKELRRAVLSAEVYGERGGKAISNQELGGILNSTVENALQQQKDKNINLKGLLFDVSRLKGKSTENMPYSQRKELLGKFIKYLPEGKFELPHGEHTPEGALALYKKISEGKHPLTSEGIVIHPNTGTPMKHKIMPESDVYITGTFPAEKGSKYEGKGIGGFTYSLDPHGKTVGRIGTGLDDSLRELAYKNPEAFVGRVAKIHSHGQFPKSKAHRVPALNKGEFAGIHEDYSADQPAPKTASDKTVLTYNVHGDEPAGELVAQETFAPNIEKVDVGNHSGKRRLDGVDLNRHFDAEGETPKNKEVLNTVLSKKPGLLVDLHENDEADGAYAYASPGMKDEVKNILKNMQHKLPLANSADGDLTDDGVITDGKYPGKGALVTAANKRGIPYVLLETPSSKAPIQERVEYQKEFIDKLNKEAADKVEMQEHQKRLAEKLKNNPGVLAYWGLGSGKTLGAINAVDELGGKADVVVPASLKDNFIKEVKKKKSSPKNFNVSSYEKYTREQEPKNKDVLVLDEAHRIKNSGSKRSQAIQHLANEYKKVIMLSGTPIQNKPHEIASLINTLAKEKRFPVDEKDFNAKYVDRDVYFPGFFARLMGKKPHEIVSMKNKQDFQNRVHGLVDYYTPSKENFPDSEEEIVKVPMSPEQIELHKYYENRLPYSARVKLRNSLSPNKRDSSAINSFLSKTRQVANVSGRENTLVESPKIRALIDRISEIKGPQVVYSNFLGSGIEPITEKLNSAGKRLGVFTGELSRNKKNELVHKYNKGLLDALLLSSSGGEGLDLKNTRAVHILEPHWHDPKIDQVIGRAIRYKSHEALPPEERKVQIYKYLSEYPEEKQLFGGKKKTSLSADEYLYNLAKKKQQLNEQFLETLRKASDQ